MSTQAVREILAKAKSDADFGAALVKDPDTALKPYASRLTAQEMAGLRGLTREVLAAVQFEPAQPKHWWAPTSYKEFGASILSLLLILLLMYAVVSALVAAGAAPIITKIGDEQHLTDGFERAKELLNILLPFFGSVVTFWLGVAVESKRGDENAAKADQEAAARENAVQDTVKTKIAAADMIGRTRGMVDGAALRADRGGIDDAKSVTLDREKLLGILSEGQEALRG